jgi:hypothetical protein
VQSWQIMLGLFFALLPLVLMRGFWGDERLTARGRPVERPWRRRRTSQDVDHQAAHDPAAHPGP